MDIRMGRNLPYDIERIKSKVSMPSVVSLYGTIDSEQRTICPFHDDHHPSFRVYENGGKCYACGATCDIFGWVMKKESMNFLQAVKFVADREGILPEVTVAKSQSDYRGPVPLTIINHWHSQLSADKREYLYKRLLTDETLDVNRIGYAQDQEAYTIPFWSGVPGHSAVEIIQYRATPDYTRDSKRYWGYKYHNKPSIIGRHLINPELVIVLFGTIDQLLAEQDGLPVIAPSAIEGFRDPKSDQVIELKKLLANTKKIVVVPDGTLTEFAAAYNLADLLGAEVKFFPKDCGAKDYNEYRMSGKTAKDFIVEVLEMPEFLYYTDDNYIQYFTDLLDSIIDGNEEAALTYLLVFREENKYPFVLISRNIQFECGKKPFYSNFFTSEEFLAMAEDFYGCNDYEEAVAVVLKWCEIANTHRGAF